MPRMLTYLALCLLWPAAAVQPAAASAPAGQLFIDEILADPPSGLAGDANNDGRRHTYEDEFVELYNPGPEAVDLEGWRLGDDDSPWERYFAFPAGTVLQPGDRLLLFGGGRPSGLDTAFFVDDGRIGNGLSNGGDTVLLLDAHGDTVARVEGRDWPSDRSSARQPDGTYRPHRPAAFSPGRAEAGDDGLPAPPSSAPPPTAVPLPTPPDSSDAPVPPDTTTAPPQTTLPPNAPPYFTSVPPPTARAGFTYRYPVTAADPEAEPLVLSLTAAPPWLTLDQSTLSGVPPDGPARTFAVALRLTDGSHDIVQEFTIERRPRPQIRIAEILADPPPGAAGDANGDGLTDAYGDEFIELYNEGPDVDLDGCTLSDDDAPAAGRFAFPPGTRLARHGQLVLFGRPPGKAFAGAAFGDDGRIGNGLGNGADRLQLLCGPDTLLDHPYTSAANIDQSLLPQADGSHLRHGDLPGRTAFSPGAPRPVYLGFGLDTLTLTEGQRHLPPPLLGHWKAGTDTLHDDHSIWDDLTWFTPDTTRLRILADGRLHALWPGRVRLTAWYRRQPLAAGTVTVVQAPDPPHQPPRFDTQPDTLAYAGLRYEYHSQATDPEKATLHYTLAEGPDWLHLDQHDGVLSGRPPAGAPRVHAVAIEAHDGRGKLARQRFYLQVHPRPRLRITEILADPPPGAHGDANGDGRRHSYEDEFIEIFHAGPDTLELTDCILHAGGRRLPLPPMPMPPRSYLTVFGGGDSADGRLSAGGRLGRGLHNRRGQVALTLGGDTLDHVHYDLDRAPRQSLHLAAEASPPTLHGALPGYGPHSPGRPRPQLTRLDLHPPRLDLIVGDTARVAVQGLFSDGTRRPLPPPLPWRVADNLAIDSEGRLAANRPGTTFLDLTIDTVRARLPVRIRPTLAGLLRFYPPWDRLDAPPGQPQHFAVLPPPDQHLLYNWRLNGRPLRTHAPELTHTPKGTRPDTLEVLVHSRSERHRHRWILLPPPAASAFPNPFNPQTAITFTLPQAGHTRLDIHAANGQLVRRLLDADLGPGPHRMTWNALDQQGRPVATGLYFYRLRQRRHSVTGKLLLVR